MFIKDNVLYWRVILSLCFAIFVNMFLQSGFGYVPVLAAVGFILSFIIFENKQIEQVANYILDKKFDDIADFFYRCLIINISMTMFLTLVILAGYYNNKPEYPVAVIFYSLFIFNWVLIFVAKKFSIKIPFCFKARK